VCENDHVSPRQRCKQDGICHPLRQMRSPAIELRNDQRSRGGGYGEVGSKKELAAYGNVASSCRRSAFAWAMIDESNRPSDDGDGASRSDGRDPGPIRNDVPVRPGPYVRGHARLESESRHRPAPVPRSVRFPFWRTKTRSWRSLMPARRARSKQSDSSRILQSAGVRYPEATSRSHFCSMPGMIQTRQCPAPLSSQLILRSEDPGPAVHPTKCAGEAFIVKPSQKPGSLDGR